jgi:transposase
VRTRPHQLTADRGYDSRKFRQYLHRRGIRHCIPPIKHTGRFKRKRLPRYDPKAYARRWIVERSNAWLQNYRRIVVRQDRLLSTYHGFVLLACIMISLSALLK